MKFFNVALLLFAGAESIKLLPMMDGDGAASSGGAVSQVDTSESKLESITAAIAVGKLAYSGWRWWRRYQRWHNAY